MAAAVEADIAVAAVVGEVRPGIRLVAPAQVVVDATGTGTAETRVEIGQIRCAKAGGYRSAQQQALEWAVLKAQRVGELARAGVAVAVAVVAAGGGHVQLGEDRNAEFVADR